MPQLAINSGSGDRLIDRTVRSALEEDGVPTDVDALYRLVQRIFNPVRNARKDYYRAAVRSIAATAAANGIEIAPAPPADYRPYAVMVGIAHALGWRRETAPLPAALHELPRAEQLRVLADVVPFPDDPTDPIIVDQVHSRITATLQRHGKAAARQAIVDTADLNRTRDRVTHEVISPGPRAVEIEDGEIIVDVDDEVESRIADLEDTDKRKPSTDEYDKSAGSAGGKHLGWARVLTGAENCTFCAMLASRGPVYTEQTVLTATDDSARDGFRYHDHCDCIAVLVVRGKPWTGEDQFTALQDMWDDARENPTSDELDAGLYSTRERFDRRYKAAIEQDPKTFAAVPTQD